MNISPATDADRGPIVDSWLRSYRTAHAAGLISMQTWDDVMRGELNTLLDRSQVLVARGTRSDTFYGWVAFAPPKVVHYVYVWRPYRGRAVGRTLLRAADMPAKFVYSCRTCAGERLIRKLGLRQTAKFNPLPARFGSPKETHVKGPIVEYRRSA